MALTQFLSVWIYRKMKDSADKVPSKYGFDLDKYGCVFGKSTMAKTSSTTQRVLENRHHELDEMTMELVRRKAEQFALDLIVCKLFQP